MNFKFGVHKLNLLLLAGLDFFTSQNYLFCLLFYGISNFLGNLMPNPSS